jgi:uroporphyrinogen decarboxylase
MISRDRLIASLEHRELDRVPITLGGPSSSFHKIAHQKLLDYLGFIAQADAPIIDNILQIVEPDKRLIEYFHVDTLWLLPQEAPVLLGPGHEDYKDEFGRMFTYSGKFYDQVDYPLKNGTVSELTHYIFPDLTKHNRFAGLKQKAMSLYNSGYGLGADGAWGIYEICSSLRSTTNFFMDLVDDPKYTEELAERVLEEYHKPFYGMLLDVVGPYIQIVGISDDLGSQQGLLFSPKIFRNIFKPRLQKLVEFIHTKVDAKVYMHSDGSIIDILPDLIEIGVDGINPVQYSAKGMSLAQLKKEYGKDLGFLGGTIDNTTLSFGNTEDVRNIVKKNIKILAPGGGFIISSIHNITPEVPPENIVTLFDVGYEHGKYQ